MLQPPDIFREIYARHGHRCPMSTLGGRLGLAAAAALGEAQGVRRAVFHHDTCALDGIELTTGCTRAEGTLQVRREGRHVLTLIGDGEAVRVTIRQETLERAARYRQLDDRIEREREILPSDVLEGLVVAKTQVLQEVLEAFWSLPDEELLEIVRGVEC